MFRFVKDNDGHWYLIPYEKVTDFHFWVQAMENDLVHLGEYFGNYRINSPSDYIINLPVEI